MKTNKTHPLLSINFLWVLCMSILLANGTALAIQYVESSAGLQSPAWEGGDSELEFGDINGDGNLDIVSVGDHGSPYINTQEHGIMVYFGDGAGSWSVLMVGNLGYGGCAVGDVNGDARMDVGYGIHHNYSGNDFGDQLIEVVLGDGTGSSWIPWDDGLATSGEDYGMFATDFGDVDNDGDLDLVSNSFGCCAGVHVYINNGDGTWTQSFGFTGGNSQAFMKLGDVNNDGNLDIAVTQQYGTVYFGDGTGDFTLADYNLPSPGNIGHAGISMGDVNRDGGADVAWINSSGGIEVYGFDTTSNQWNSLSGNLPSSGGYTATQLYDMDNDGWLDMVATGTAVVVTWIASSTSPGNWTWATYTSTGPSPGSMSAFRVDGDADHNGYGDYAVLVDEGSYPSDINHLRFFKETSVANDLFIVPQYPRGLERLIGGSVRFIDWTCGVPQGQDAVVDLDLSLQGENGPWISIAEAVPNNGRYQWLVPSEYSSDFCYIRYTARTTSDTATAITYDHFAIMGGGGVPVMVVDPTVLDFDTVYVDSTEVLTFSISNAGTDTLHVEPFLSTLDAYILNAGTDPITLDPGNDITVEVAFTPTEATSYQDSIVIDSDGGNAVVHLRGVGEEYSAVGDQNIPVPREFVFDAPYPNPFNASVTLPFSVPEAGRIEAEAVNVMGQQVARIANRSVDAGYHRLTWDASTVSSGVYFVVLRYKGQTSIRKTVLMK
jgi:hypothetical protein